MAINVKKLVYKIRYKANDLNEVQYSDFDVKEAINDCIRYLNQEKSMKNSDFLEKIKHYVQDEMNAEVQEYNEQHPTEPKPLYDFPTTGAEIPEDLISLVDIMRTKDGYHMSPIPAVEQINPHQQGQYKIVNGRIYANTDFDMLYRAEIAQISLNDMSSSTAVIELPSVFTELVAKVATMILLNSADTDVLLKEVERVTDYLVSGRRYNNIKVRMPFKV
jgi:hypothetical protein